MYPDKLKYTKEHEWVDQTGDNGAVGITYFAQKELGDVVFVELPEIGRELKQGEILGTVESVKAVSEIYSPVSGNVTEVNTELRDHPELINADPYGRGWILKLRLSSAAEMGGLMDSTAYTALVGQSGH